MVKSSADRKSISSGPSRFADWSSEYQVIALDILGAVSRITNRFLLDTTNADSEAGRDFLIKRGIGLDEALEYQFGFLSASLSFESLCHTYAQQSELEVLAHKYTPGLLSRVGLFKPNKGNLIPFRGNSIVLPEYSPHGPVVNVFLRLLDPAKPGGMKFVGLTGFGKKLTSYGLIHALPAITSHKTAIIVEGAFDLLSMTRGVNPDLRVVVAPVGCQIFVELVDVLVANGCERIVFALDGDDAGIKGTTSAIDRLFPYLEDRGVKIGWLRWSRGKDPDDLLRNHSPETREHILKEVITGKEFTIFDDDMADGILCRYIPEVSANTVVAETCIDLDVDQIQIPRVNKKGKRGRRDFRLLRMRCQEETHTASLHEGRGLNVLHTDFDSILSAKKFALLAIFVILLRAVARARSTVDLDTLLKQTSLSESSVRHALKNKMLGSCFAIHLDIEGRNILIKPSGSLLRSNQHLESGLGNLGAVDYEVDLPPEDDGCWG